MHLSISLIEVYRQNLFYRSMLNQTDGALAVVGDLTLTASSAHSLAAALHLKRVKS